MEQKKRGPGRPRKDEKKVQKVTDSLVLLERMTSDNPRIAHNRNKDLVITKDSAFQVALKRAGVDEDYVAEKLKEAMNNEVIKMNADGSPGAHKFKDMHIMLKAIEMWVNVFGYKEKAKEAAKPTKDTSPKHLHIHGLSGEDLDAAIEAAEIRKDKTSSEE